MIHAFIPGHVRLVHDLDMSQILHAERGFPAGDDEPNRVPLLNAQRLAILAVGHDHVLHGLRQRKGVSKLASVSPSETSQLAPLCTPASFNNTESGTPLHSLQLVIPWMNWTGNPRFGSSEPWIAGELFPWHSRK